MGFPIVPRQRDAVATTVPIRRLIHLLVFAGALAIPEAAQADCTPAFSSGQPPAGTTVTCTGTTDGNPAGYGDGSQTGLTIDVQPMATVKGVVEGFVLGATNIITNDGTISDDGANNPRVNGISTSGSIDLTNNQAGVISVATTSTDPTANAIGVNASTMVTGSNAGLISATASASEAVAIQSDAIDFTNTGTISASGSNANGTLGVFAVQSLALTNSGNVSADGGTGTTGTAVESDGTLNVINLAGGSITATETNTTFASVGVFAGGSSGGGNDIATISNAGTISGADIGVVSFSDSLGPETSRPPGRSASSVRVRRASTMPASSQRRVRSRSRSQARPATRSPSKRVRASLALLSIPAATPFSSAEPAAIRSMSATLERRSNIRAFRHSTRSVPRPGP